MDIHAKLFVAITNVTIGSDATIAASSPCCPATARLCAVRHRFAYLPPSTPCPVRPSAPKPHSPASPPCSPRLILGLPPDLYAL